MFTVIIGDRDRDRRGGLAGQLVHHGYRVDEVASAEALIESAKGGAYDVALIGEQLGDKPGLEVIAALRAMVPAKLLPIIAIVQAKRPEAGREAIWRGASDVIEWPAELPVLLARISAQVSRRRAESTVERLERTQALIVEGTRDGTWLWDVAAETVIRSPKWFGLLGYATEAIDKTIDGWLSCVHPADVHRVRRALASHVEGVTADLDIEYRIRHANNTYRWFQTHAAAERGPDGRATRIAGSDSDVTDRKVLDAVTGLPNRTYFTDRVAHTMSRAARLRDASFAVIVLGIDGFANVRESLGQTFCDELLSILGSRLISCMRPMDTVACLGENLFAIAAEEVRDPGDAVRIVDRLTREAGHPVTLDGEDVFVTIRAGIALAAGYSSPDEILRDATVAMNQARNQGSVVYEVFDPAMHARAMGRLKLETELHRAIQQQQFVLHFQPVYDLKGNKLQGFEALLRWRHPDGRLILPGDFIALAESTGLIVPMGAWVLDAAARQLVSWREGTEDKLDLSISVNVSGKQLGRRDFFVDTISRVVEESGINPGSLTLEITESAVMDDIGKALNTLEHVKRLGVRLALDDFGTGYSSLSLLDRLPVDMIKIDRGFVRKMAEDERRSTLVSVVVDLAHRLGLQVVAEGIETEDDARRLSAMGCEFGQGYYFARPLGAPAARLLIARAVHPQATAMAG